jgi:hypothetical protein
MKILIPEELKYVKCNVTGRHGTTDLIDDLFFMSFKVTDEEFNFMCANASAEETDILVVAVSQAEERLKLFIKIRKALEFRNKYLGVFQ